ncbi:uncharacterized protein [Anabrus simplex]|uniref:uncharacterized protein n=1 Tax=Anabrus simplex TaxID=316456 RepID=UPI0035A28624
MQKNTEKFSKMKEEYKAMCKAVREEKLRKDTADKKTSCTNLIKVRNKCTQAWVDCPRCEDVKREKKASGPGVRLTKSELFRLEKDMQALKMVINQREAMWCKLAERERLQRVQLTRLNNELTNLRALSETRQNELENKTQALSDLNMQVERQRLESASLRRHILKLERRER